MDSDAESDDDEDEYDDDDDPFTSRRKDTNNEHSNPHSYSWCIMRHACIIIAQQNLERFLTVSGIELTGQLTSLSHHMGVSEFAQPLRELFLRKDYVTCQGAYTQCLSIVLSQ